MTKKRMEEIINRAGFSVTYEPGERGTTVVFAHRKGTGTIRLGRIFDVAQMNEATLREALDLGSRPSGGGNVA